MRYAKLIIGIVLLIKGIKAAFALPASLSAVHVPAGAAGFASAYAAGEAAGLVIGTLAILAGGVILFASGLVHRRGGKQAVSAA